MKLFHGSLEIVKNPEIRDFSRTLDFDIVYGPVADDMVYASFALFEGGLLSLDNLIAELKTYRLVDQYLFHTEKSLELLEWTEAKEVTL